MPSRVLWWLPRVGPLFLVAMVVWARWPAAAPQPIDVGSNAPVFATLDELVAASDLIVVATIDNITAGRAITDPVEPAAGIRTTLYALRIETVVAGPTLDSVVVEHETSLLDGTPITLDGIAPPDPDARGLYFLLAGDSQAFPHHVVIGAQGRHRLHGPVVEAVADDPVSRGLDGRSIDEVVAEIRGVA